MEKMKPRSAVMKTEEKDPIIPVRFLPATAANVESVGVAPLVRKFMIPVISLL